MADNAVEERVEEGIYIHMVLRGVTGAGHMVHQHHEVLYSCWKAGEPHKRWEVPEAGRRVVVLGIASFRRGGGNVEIVT
jgi:hypothetical protein